MKKLSKAEQDELTQRLITEMETMDSDEWGELCEQLDERHRQEVRDAAREFANNAIGDEHWDSDETG